MARWVNPDWMQAEKYLKIGILKKPIISQTNVTGF